MAWACFKKQKQGANSTESIFACNARCFGFAVTSTLTIQIRYWHGSAGTAPCSPVHQAQMRHNETRERAKSLNTGWVLTAPLTDHSYSLEDERPLPASALPPTLHRQLLLSISRTDSFLKLQAAVDELLQRRGPVLTHLSSLPPNSSKQQAPLISFLVSTQMPGSLTTDWDICIHSIGLTRPMPATLDPPIGCLRDSLGTTLRQCNFLGARGHLSPTSAALVHRRFRHPGTVRPTNVEVTSILPSSTFALQNWQQPLHRAQSGHVVRPHGRPPRP